MFAEYRAVVHFCIGFENARGLFVTFSLQLRDMQSLACLCFPFFCLSFIPNAAELSTVVTATVMRLEPARQEGECPEFDVPSIPTSPTTISRLYTHTVEGLACTRRIELRSNASVREGFPPASLSPVRRRFRRPMERDAQQVALLTASLVAPRKAIEVPRRTNVSFLAVW
jgi:hypothetical protein